MSDLIVIQPQVTELTVTEDVNQVVVSSVGVQGATGATGAKGDTGDQGPSGVIAVTAPITNSGTSTSANIGVSAGSTSTAGVLQLTDSTSSTSTTTAATPNAVKAGYDFAKSQVLPFLSGRYYKGMGPILGATVASTLQRTYYVPFFVPVETSFDRILAKSGSNFSGSSIVRLGIYNSSADGLPTTVLLDAGTVNFTSANQSLQITISETLGPGLYFLAANSQTAATTNSYVSVGSNSAASYTGIPYDGGLVMYQYYYQAGVSGAFATASGVILGALSGAINAFLRAV